MASHAPSVATVAKVTLGLTDAEAAMLRQRSADPTSVVSDLVATPGTSQWATPEELGEAQEWLAAAAAELNEPAFATALRVEDHELAASWQWPDSPLVAVHLDGEVAGVVDYLPASASAHWFLRWTAEVSRPRPAAALPLITLAGHFPEEAEEDESMLAVVLGTALTAAIAELTGRAVGADAPDG